MSEDTEQQIVRLAMSSYHKGYLDALSSSVKQLEELGLHEAAEFLVSAQYTIAEVNPMGEGQ